MVKPHADLKSLIATRVEGAPGAVWTAVDFLDLGRREAVDKALQRLVASQALRRIGRGLYDKPRSLTVAKKPSVPDYRRIVEAIGRRDQVRMVIDGMTAANDLGLSDDVPGEIVAHIDGRLQPINIGHQTIRFRPTSASKLYWAGRPAMRVVQALHWLRDKLAGSDVRLQVTARLREILAKDSAGAAIAADLRDGLVTLPAWMQDFLRELLADDHHSLGERRDGMPCAAPDTQDDSGTLGDDSGRK